MKISKYLMRIIISISYSLQLLITALAAIFIPFIAANGVAFFLIISIINTLFYVYLLDIRNIKGWWARKIFEANQRIDFRRRVADEIKRRDGLGYGNTKG